MIDFISTIESNVQRLQLALSKDDEELFDRELSALEENLLDNQGYHSIGDERLLVKIIDLLSKCCAEAFHDKLEKMSQHLEIVRAIHEKFYAILDYNIGLDDLLYMHLDRWPQLEERLDCKIGSEVKNKLHEARSVGDTEQRLQAFLRVFFQHLRAEGFDSEVNILQHLVDLALEGYKRWHSWTVQALFATKDGGEVHGLKIRAAPQGSGTIRVLNHIDDQMESAAQHALACVKEIWPQARMWDFTWNISRNDISFAGNSIGLALTIGILSEIEGFRVDAYTGFTGHVEWDTGAIKQIDQLDQKLVAASKLGIRRVFIPRDNEDQIKGGNNLEIIPVASIAEAKEWLQNRTYEHGNTPLERLAEARIRELEIELKHKGIRKVEHIQKEEFCKRVEFSDHQQRVIVNVFHGQKGLKAVVAGQDSLLKRTVEEVRDKVFEAIPQKSETKSNEQQWLRAKYLVKNFADQQKIERYIFGRDDSIRESEQHCIYRAKIVTGHQTVFVRQFSNGSLTIDGPVTLFNEIDGNIQAVLGIAKLTSNADDKVQQHLDNQVRAVEAVDLGEQWIGTDESGKGDYFGPLVGAAVLVDKQIANLLNELGVRDSKKLTDRRAQELAIQIRQICGNRAQVVMIPPERYNTLYDQFQKEGKNLNTLLAWVHTRALEDILAKFPQKQITVLVDKFADESFIQNKLLEKGRQTNLNLVQLPKAEVNVAVAAASVLARAQFLQWLDRFSKQYKIDLPKGSSDPRIVQIGKQIVTRKGQGELAKIAKLHFKTTQQIMGSN